MPTSVAITSLIANKKSDSIYNIYIIADNISEKSINIFKNIKYTNVHINIINISDTEHIKLHPLGKTKNDVTTAALLKFKIPNMLNHHSKVLYLDGDVIVLSDISELFNTNVENYYACVIRDTPQIMYKKRSHGEQFGNSYFNSGVMVLNLAKMRDNNISKKLIDEKAKSQDISLMDQDVFNIVLKGHVKYIPLKYNVCYSLLAWNTQRYTMKTLNDIFATNYLDLNDILKDTIILHFASPYKPWKYYDIPLGDLWLQYYYLSPFKIISLNRISKNQEDELAQTRSELRIAKNDINRINSSYSFHVGSIITYIPRKILAFFRCLKKYGFKHTMIATIQEIKRALKIILRRK